MAVAVAVTLTATVTTSSHSLPVFPVQFKHPKLLEQPKNEDHFLVGANSNNQKMPVFGHFWPEIFGANLLPVRLIYPFRIRIRIWV